MKTVTKPSLIEVISAQAMNVIATTTMFYVVYAAIVIVHAQN